MKKGRIAVSFVLVFFAFTLISQLSSASYTLKNYTINSKTYSVGDSISGIINISLQNESADSLITSNFGGNYTLKAFLEMNGLLVGENYNCNPSSCANGYVKGDQTAQVNANTGKKVIGFVLSSPTTISTINSAKISFNSSAGPSCIIPYFVDPLNTGNKYINNNKASDLTCSSVKNRGCFVSGLETDQYSLQNIQYVCSNMTLPVAPGYKVGATLIGGPNNSAGLSMEIWTMDRSSVGSCTLPANNQNIQELECNINWSNNVQKNFFVCVKANPNTDYNVSYQNSQNACGFYKNSAGFRNTTLAFDIFARPLEYDSTVLEINDSSYSKYDSEGKTLSYRIKKYIDSNFNSACSNDCVIPITIVGGFDQQITLSNAVISYTDLNGVTKNSNTLYEVTSSPAKISSNQIILDLSKLNITVPKSSSSTGKFILSLGNNKILEYSIDFVPSSYSFNINPNLALIGINTKFGLTSNSTISSASWNFGDGTTAYGKNVSHKYNQAGIYSVAVTANFSGTYLNKTFTVEVGSPRDSALLLINRYQSRLSKINIISSSFSADARSMFNKKIDISSLQTTVNNIASEFNVSSSDEEYSRIVDKLLALNVPESISKKKFGTLPLSAGLSNINPDPAIKLSGTSSEVDIVEAIKGWDTRYYNANIEFEQWTSYSENGEIPLFTKVNVDLNPLLDLPSNTNPKLIISNSDADIKFSNVNGQPLDSSSYVSVEGIESVQFIIPGNVEPSELGIYISPDLGYLGSIDKICDVDDPTCVIEKPYWIFYSTVILVIIVLLGIYIFLQEWYKKHYERYLFKNPDDLYNVINFIYNSRSSGLKDTEIKKKLVSSGWSKEQLTFAFRKMAGKRTGMFEIPLFKFAENNKVRKEIEKRQQRPIDTRFIKRPNL